jgi:hypothetical protein
LQPIGQAIIVENSLVGLAVREDNDSPYTPSARDLDGLENLGKFIDRWKWAAPVESRDGNSALSHDMVNFVVCHAWIEDGQYMDPLSDIGLNFEPGHDREHISILRGQVRRGFP